MYKYKVGTFKNPSYTLQIRAFVPVPQAVPRVVFTTIKSL